MRKILVTIAALLPIVCFCQFSYINQFGVGVDAPLLNPFHTTLLVPAIQIDYKHEFYYKTRRYFLTEKSLELRLGFVFTNLQSTSLKMGNIGIQYTYRADDWMLAYGADLVVFISETSAIPGRFAGVKQGGTFGEGEGLGLFYKVGRRLSDSWSLSAEVGALIYVGNFYTWRYGELTYAIDPYPFFGLYRANISLNYHF